MKPLQRDAEFMRGKAGTEVASVADWSAGRGDHEAAAKPAAPKDPDRGSLGEIAQAKIRFGMNIAIIVFALIAYHYNSALGLGEVWATFSVCAFSAVTLYIWARLLSGLPADSKWRIGQRATSIVLDNLAVTWLLYFGGETLAGAYGIYLWITIGYGMRYGLGYLYGNLFASFVGYLVITQVSPFWRANPSLSIGLGTALLVVPIYAAFLIKRLHSAVREAQRAYAAKSDFVAKMSHELRTPLHGIIAIADLMERSEASAHQKEMIRIISVSSNTLLDLINRILDISKFEDGTFALQREQMDLHGVVNETVAILWPQVQAKGLGFTCFIDTAIEQHVIGSPRQLQEVLINLCGNAVKFTDTGHVLLTVGAENATAREVGVKFEIQDSGPGIAKEHLEKIFDPFYQADNTLTRKHGGTGLGTAIARELVRLMGGDISVTSEMGRGTTFTLHLKFDRDPLPDNVTPFYPIDILVVAPAPTAEVLAGRLVPFGARVTRHALNDLPPLLPNGEAPAAVLVDIDAYPETAADVRARVLPSNQGSLIPIFGFTTHLPREAAVDRRYNGLLQQNADAVEFGRFLNVATTLRRDFEPTLPATVSAGTKRVLVAEDNATNQMIARLALAQAGFSCTIVDNGEDALARLADSDYDVAVIDMHMPRMDGLELARLYNFAHPDPDRRIPIVMMTADNRPEVVADAEFAGITKFLVKPIKPSLLIEAINRLIAERQADPLEKLSSSADPSDRADSGETIDLIEHTVVDELLGYMEQDERGVFFSEFAQDAAGYIASISEGCRGDSLDNARDQMHALSGAARTVGAMRLAAYARRVEFMSAEQMRADETQLTNDLTALLHESERQLRQLAGLPQHV